MFMDNGQINNVDIQYTPMLNISNQTYEPENVTVTVEWTQLTGVTYTVIVSPSVPTVNLIGTTRYQLTIPYNRTYNFSVVAATPCRPNATNFITLNYGELSVMQYYVVQVTPTMCSVWTSRVVVIREQ